MGRKMREENGVALPKRVWRVIDKCREGQKLSKTLRPTEEGMHVATYALEPEGHQVVAGLAHEAIKSGFLRPCGDGLFEVEFSQTWEAA